MGTWGYFVSPKEPAPDEEEIATVVRGCRFDFEFDADLILWTTTEYPDGLEIAQLTLEEFLPGEPWDDAELLIERATPKKSSDSLVARITDARFEIAIQFLNVDLWPQDDLLDPLLLALIARYEGIFCNEAGQFWGIGEEIF
jgi:hypothetical protein